MTNLLERRRLMLQKTEEQIDPYILQPFTMRTLHPCFISLISNGEGYSELSSIKYNLNNQGWIPITSLFTSEEMWEISLVADDVIQFIGCGAWAMGPYTGVYLNITSSSVSTQYFDLEGNVVSLFGGDDFASIVDVPDYALYYALYAAFSSSYKLRNISNLRISAKNIGKNSFSHFISGGYSSTGDLRKLFNGIEDIKMSGFSWLLRGDTNAVDSFTAIKLPNVDSYAEQCFNGAFGYNKGLIWAEIPSTTDSIGSVAFSTLFTRCSNLCFIDCRLTAYNNSTFRNWVNGVYTYGCFLKHPDATWPRGTAGIPTNWEVFDYTTDWKFGKMLTSDGKEVEQLTHVATPWIPISEGCTSITYTLPTGNYTGSKITAVLCRDSNGNEYWQDNLVKGTTNGTVNIPAGTVALRFGLLISSLPITWIKETVSGTYLWKGCKVT